MGSRGLMVDSRTPKRKVVSSSLGPAGIVGEGSECPALSPPSIPRRGALEQGTEPPTPPRRSLTGCPLLWLCSRCVCVFMVCVCVCFTAVCVCPWMGECRARIPSMGHHRAYIERI